MKRIPAAFVVLSVIFALVIGIGILTRAKSTAASTTPPILEVEGTANNLLLDGDMEDQPYYWRYPNHFVAPHWNRWWYKDKIIPEFDDTRDVRVHYEGEHAQVYFIWGKLYTAGIYQVVTGLTACTPYELSAFGRTHSLDGAIPNARVGLDPEGTQLTPNDDVGDIVTLPSKTQWSPKQTDLFVWEKLSVQAEPINDQLTAILYAAPRPSNSEVHYYDSYWDAAALIATTFPNDRLPMPSSWSPSGFIENVNTTFAADTLTISWDTNGPASTQVWYELTYPTTPVTPTESMTHTAYFPLVSKFQNPATYAYMTTLDMSQATQHSAQIPNLGDVASVDFVILAHHSDGSACVTDVYGPQQYRILTP